MGKNKKKSKTKKDTNCQKDNSQSEGQSSVNVSKNAVPQVQSESGCWSVQSSSVKEDGGSRGSSSAKGSTRVENEFASTDSSLTNSCKNEKISSGRKRKNSKEDLYADNRNTPSNSKKSEPYRKPHVDSGDSRDTFSNKRIPVGQNNRSNSKSSRDPDFDAFCEQFKTHKGNIQYKKVNEIVENLFHMDKEYSLAHCVAEDFNMGSGIAVQFRRDFRRVGQLLNQNQRTGGLAVLEDKNRYIYYLVTKLYSQGKPTYATLFSSLKKLKEHVIQHKVGKLAMPRIGCGLDRLEWGEVKFMVEFLFEDVDVEIIVCNLQPVNSEDAPPQRHRNCKVVYETYPIEDIERGTVILYFSSEDGFVSREMERLDEKFSILREFRSANKKMGEVIFAAKHGQFLLCGCIVKGNKRDYFDFEALQKCLSKIQKENRKYDFYYYGFQAIRDGYDALINTKIINILRNNLSQAEIYVCCPGNLQEDNELRSKFGNYGSEYNKESWSRKETSRNDTWRSKDDYRKNTSQQKTEIDPQNLSNKNAIAQDNYSSETTISPEELVSQEKDAFWDQNEADPNSTLPPPTDAPNVEKESWLNLDVPSFTRTLVVNEPGPEEFALFEKEFENNQIQCSLVIEQNDLTKLPKNYSRVCFARDDLTIEAGVPPGPDISMDIGKLCDEQPKVGDMLHLRQKSDFCYFLITNKVREVCTLDKLFAAIKKLSEHAKSKMVKQLVIPRIDTKEDWRFDWSKLKCAFQYVFMNSDVTMIFAPCESEYSEQVLTRTRKITINHIKSPIHQMKKRSAIVYLASADGFLNDEMDSLQKKFDFLDDFKKQKKSLGDVIRHKQHEDNVLYGCVIRNNQSDPVSFEALQKCFKKVKEENARENFNLVGIQAQRCEDQTINPKIATVLLHTFADINISMCWPGDLREKMPVSSNKA